MGYGGSWGMLISLTFFIPRLEWQAPPCLPSTNAGKQGQKNGLGLRFYLKVIRYRKYIRNAVGG